MSHQLTKENNSTEQTVDGKAMFLITAGGQIKCLRCTASSTRTKQQCGKPALKASTTQKCQIHGGRPHSKKTLEAIAKANTRHGERTKEARDQYRKDAIFIRQLEAAMRLLKMGDGPRIRGRKPAGYRGVHSIEDVLGVLLERGEHTDKGVER
jgi:hypothetical protein